MSVSAAASSAFVTSTSGQKARPSGANCGAPSVHKAAPYQPSQTWLTLDGRRKRRKPLVGKPQAQPLQLEIEFAKVVDELFDRVAAKAERLVRARVNELTQDAPSKSAPPIKRELEEVVGFTAKDAAALVGKVANQNAQQMRRALRAARPTDGSKTLAIQIPELSSENVARLAKQSVSQIKRIPENVAQRIESIVTAAVSKGQRGEAIAAELERVLGIEKAAAKQIAIGEVVRINSAISEERHQKLGATDYIWRAIDDGHARAWHWKLNKTRQSYARPPMGGGAGPKDVGNPGSATGRACRCQALPVFETPPKPALDPNAAAKAKAAAEAEAKAAKAKAARQARAAEAKAKAAAAKAEAEAAAAAKAEAEAEAEAAAAAEAKAAKEAAAAEAEAAAKPKSELALPTAAELRKLPPLDFQYSNLAEQIEAEGPAAYAAHLERTAKTKPKAKAAAEPKSPKAKAATVPKAQPKPKPPKPISRPVASPPGAEPAPKSAPIAPPPSSAPAEALDGAMRRADVKLVDATGVLGTKKATTSQKAAVLRGIRRTGFKEGTKLKQLNLVSVSVDEVLYDQNAPGALPEGTGGAYNVRGKTLKIQVNEATTRRLLKPGFDIEKKVPANTSNIAKDIDEVIEMTAAHEYAHHQHLTEYGAAEDAIIRKAFDDPKRHEVSRYGRANHQEYWAEARTAYAYYPRDWLQRRAPKALKMVEDVLRLRGEL